MDKPITLEKICNGQTTYYDKYKALCCGERLDHKQLSCKYLDKQYCNNEFYSPTRIQYGKN